MAGNGAVEEEVRRWGGWWMIKYPRLRPTLPLHSSYRTRVYLEGGKQGGEGACLRACVCSGGRKCTLHGYFLCLATEKRLGLPFEVSSEHHGGPLLQTESIYVSANPALILFQPGATLIPFQRWFPWHTVQLLCQFMEHDCLWCVGLKINTGLL